jgi:dTDP-4-amino-4,6-dideoxygalactose transaminase
VDAQQPGRTTRVSSGGDFILDLRGDDAAIELLPRAVPFLDLRAQHSALADEILCAWREVLDKAAFVGGHPVEQFETDLAGYLGVGHVIGVANGTDAIMLALRGLGIEPGDEVITAANTFVATVEAIIHADGEPVLVDVDPNTATLDPEAVEAAITDRTRFIVPVHLYGQPAEMDAIMAIAARHDLLVVEDNAQAIGADYRGVSTGGIGHAAATSFYPGKNLGALGDGGAVTTNDSAAAERVRMIANHGQRAKYEHTEIGYNSRLDSLQAVALSIKLLHLDEWNRRRRQIADAYRDLLAPTSLTLPSEAPDRSHVYHLYVIRHPRRDALAASLAEQRIATGLHYPTPIHLMPPFLHLGGGKGTFPVTEEWASQLLSLPIGPTMTEDDVVATVTAIERALEEPEQQGERDVLQRHSA